MSLLKPTLTIGGYTLISRLLGFLRDVTIASSLGASMLSDAFFVAFKIPNFLRRLFAEGAFNSAFVPLYAGTSAGEGEAEAQAFASEAMSFLVAVLMVLSAVCIVAMPWLMIILAPGFEGDPEKYDLTVLLTQITFPYIIFISVVCLLGGVLNSVGKFAAVAATPIIMNLCLLIVPSLVSWAVPTGAHALSIAVFVAGVAQMLWLIWFARKAGVMPRLRAPRLTARVKRLLTLVAPAAMGAGVAQINLFIDLIIVSHVENGVSYLYYADRINELPLAVIGIAVSTALLPMLSRLLREGKHEQAMHQQNRAVELVLLLALPAAAALIVIAEPIIRVLYERGNFSAHDTAKTFVALQAFAAGLPAFVLVKVLAPGFYANHDTKTPFKIATLCIAVNLVLNLILIHPFSHVGMAMATTIAGWLNAGLMYWILRRRGMFKADAVLTARLPRMLLATAAMGVTLWLLQWWLAEWLNGGTFKQTAGLSLLVAGGMAVFAAAAFILKAVDRQQLRRFSRR